MNTLKHWQKLCLHTKGEGKLGKWITHNLIKYLFEKYGAHIKDQIANLTFPINSRKIRLFFFCFFFRMDTGIFEKFSLYFFSSISIGLSMIAITWIYNNYQQCHWKYDPIHITIRKVRIPLILLIETESMNSFQSFYILKFI